jgi:hypothetical protein
MKSNIIPSIIIAAAILAVALISRQSGAYQVQAFMDQLEQSVQSKDSEGNTQIGRIVKGLSSSAAEGMRKGFQGSQDEEAKRELEIRDLIKIKDVKINSGRMKNQEKVIGLVKNESSEIVQNISLNVVFKDSNGALLDVSGKFSSINGVLKPGQELGFEVDRELGDFQEKDEVLAQRKAAEVVVSITKLSILK